MKRVLLALLIVLALGASTAVAAGPEMRMIYPKDVVTDPKDLTIVIAVDDIGAQLDFQSYRLYFDGQDVTGEATLTRRLITFVAAGDNQDGRYEVVFEASERGGKKHSKRWSLVVRRKKALLTYSGSVRYEARSNNVFDNELRLNGGVGPLSAYVRSVGTKANPAEEPDLESNVSLDLGIVKLSALDVEPRLSPMALDGSVMVRGGEAELYLWLASEKAAYGLVKDAGSYDRQLVASRTSLGLGRHFSVGLDILSLVDQYDPDKHTDEDPDPEQNYLLGLDTQLQVGGFGAVGEIYGSAYFGNARTRAGADLMEGVPETVQSIFPIPDIEQDPPKVDVAYALTTTVPVGFGSLDLKGFHYGPGFTSLSGEAFEADTRGARLSFTSKELFKTLSFQVSAEAKEDVVGSPLAQFFEDPAELVGGSTYRDISVRLNSDLPAGTTGFLSVRNAEQTAKETSAFENASRDYSVGLDWIPARKLGIDFAADYTHSDYTDQDSSLDTVTEYVGARVRLMAKGIRFTPGVTLALTEEADGRKVAPTFRLTGEKSLGRWRLFGEASYGYSKMESEVSPVSTKTVAGRVEGTYRLGRDQQLSTGVSLNNFTDELAAANSSAEQYAFLKYSLSF